MIKIPALIPVNFRDLFNTRHIFNSYSFINNAVGYSKHFDSIQEKKHFQFNAFVIYINYSTALGALMAALSRGVDTLILILCFQIIRSQNSPFLDIHVCPTLISESNLQAFGCCEYQYSHNKRIFFVIRSNIHIIQVGQVLIEIVSIMIIYNLILTACR